MEVSRNANVFAFATLIVVLNGLIGHFFAPWGMALTPVVMIVVSVLILLVSTEISSIWKSVLLYVFIAFNDILIKLYSGGYHDQVGSAWMLLFTLIGLVPVAILLIVSYLVCKDDTDILQKKIISFFLFYGLVLIHFYLFQNLGLGRYY